jgi:hypothetical protein
MRGRETERNKKEVGRERERETRKRKEKNGETEKIKYG